MKNELAEYIHYSERLEQLEQERIEVRNKLDIQSALLRQRLNTQELDQLAVSFEDTFYLVMFDYEGDLTVTELLVDW